jgi:hypothetical protein
LSSLVLPTSQAKADESFDIKRVDHQLHAAVSYGSALTITRFFETREFSRPTSVLYASLITIGLGLTKEIVFDKSVSSGDMVANALGTGVSAAVVFAFEL